MEPLPDVPKQETFLDALLVYMLIFVSGSHIYRQSSDKFLVITFIVLVLVWLFRADRKINNAFVLYVCVFVGFLLTINLYTGGGVSLPSIISTTLKLVFAYLLLKTVGNNFTSVYINVVVLLAGVSLFGYLSDTFNLMGGVIHRLYQVGDIGYEGIFYMFRFQDHIDRNSSIFFEPGAYQAFLNAALFLLFFVKTNFSTSRKWFYILLLLTALITTFSTTGYMIFAATFFLLLAKSKMLSISSKAALGGMLLVILVLFSAKFYSVIFEKIGNYVDIQHITDSADRRSFDMLVDLEIFKEHVFGVGFDKYLEQFSAIGLVEEAGSSNGITKTLAIYGLPFSLFVFSSYYWAIRRLVGWPLMSIIPFGMLLVFFVGEAYYVFTPFCMTIIAAVFIYGRSVEDKGVERETEVIQ